MYGSESSSGEGRLSGHLGEDAELLGLDLYEIEIGIQCMMDGLAAVMTMIHPHLCDESSKTSSHCTS